MKVKHLLLIISVTFFLYSIYKHSSAKSCIVQYDEYCQQQLLNQIQRQEQEAADAERPITLLEQQQQHTYVGHRADNPGQELSVIEQLIVTRKHLPPQKQQQKEQQQEEKQQQKQEQKQQQNKQKDQKQQQNKQKDQDQQQQKNQKQQQQKQQDQKQQQMKQKEQQKVPSSKKAPSKGTEGATSRQYEVTAELTDNKPLVNFIEGYVYPNITLIRPPVACQKSHRMNKIVSANAQEKFLSCTPAKLPRERFAKKKRPFVTGKGSKKHLIFCASSGSSGTLYLANLLGTAKGVDSEQYRDPEMKGEWLAMTNERPMKETLEQRRVKMNAIKEYVTGGAGAGKVYAETSNMFIKTFWDVVISEASDFNVDVIALRRHLPRVLIDMIRRGKGEAIRPDEYNTTLSVNAVHRPPLFFTPTAFERLLRYAIDIELRTQAFITRIATVPNVRVTEVSLGDINTTAGVARLFEELGIEATEKTERAAGVPLPVPYVPTTLAEKRRYLPCSRELSVAEAKARIFAYLTRLTPEHIPVLPQLRSPTMYAGRPPKIVAATIVPKNFAGAQNVLYAHLTNALQFAQTAVVVGDVAQWPGIAAAAAAATATTNKADNNNNNANNGNNVNNGINGNNGNGGSEKVRVVSAGGFPNAIAAFMSLDTSVRPTHVICNDFLVGFSDSFKQNGLLQQLVLALEPGEALYVLPSKAIKVKRRHRIAAFAMSQKIADYIAAAAGKENGGKAPIKFKNLPFVNKYYVDEGAIEIDWYPRYNLVPILDA